MSETNNTTTTTTTNGETTIRTNDIGNSIDGAPQLPIPSPPPTSQQLATSIPIIQNTTTMEKESKHCWVCFATDNDDKLASWVQPCKCSGATKWVHQACLQRWIDVKQKGNSFKRVNCPQCQTEYIIMFPATGTLIGIMENFDTMIKRLSPFLAAGVLVGSLYWTAVTHGAITVLQVVGHKEGLEIMENTDPFVLLVGLPTIPVGLIIGRMFRWEDIILRYIQSRQRNASKFPLLNLFAPSLSQETDNQDENDTAEAQYQNAMVISNSVSATRVLCGAMLLPTFSTIFGRIFFDSIQNNIHRTIAGGLTFIAIKGVIKIYFQQKQFHRRRQRKIMDYNEENLIRYGHLDTRLRNLFNSNEQSR